MALWSILALAVCLNFYRLDQNGYTNEYYAAAVKSMLANWHNFFFNAYDPGGFITLDKPPVAFWLQTVSAWLFGYSEVSLLLPSAIAGVVSVALVYYLIQRTFGPVAGLLAALALAVTPISVVMNRHNNPESLLILALLVGVWAISNATSKGKLTWLLLAMVAMGIAFNIKMLEAFIVLPVFYLVYLLLAPIKWWKRIAHLALASLVLTVISLAWIVTVDLTPSNQRPYIGGSTDNTVMNLVVGYNGLSRIDSTQQGGGGNRFGPANGFQPPAGLTAPGNGQPNFGQRPTGGGPGFGSGISGVFAGQPGPLRLLLPDLAGEAGWLLPLALLGLIVAVVQSWRRFRTDKEQRRQRWQALLLWGGWLLMYGVVFSTAGGTFHSYYTVLLAPATAALVGIGAEALWHTYQKGNWQSWLLPLGLLGTALFQFNILSSYADWNRTLILVVMGLELVCASLLIAIPRWLGAAVNTRWTQRIAVVASLGLLAAPLVWAVNAILNKTYTNATLPTAVPANGAITNTAANSTYWLTVLGTHWNVWLTALVICLAGFVVVALVLRFWPPRKGLAPKRLNPFVTVASVALVMALGLSLVTTALPPVASAASARTATSGPASTGIIGNPSFALSDSSKLISFLEANRAGRTYLLATATSENASPIIIQTGQPVMSLGGFMGSDKTITSVQLAQLVKNNTVRYFLLDNSAMGGGRGGNASQQPISWVQQNCQLVNSQLWSSGSTAPSISGANGGVNSNVNRAGGFGGGSQAQLYDCAPSA